MEKKIKNTFKLSLSLLLGFLIWTMMILYIDVKAIGVNDTLVGLATMNQWFHKLTGVHISLYIITDWLGLVPVAICLIFGCLGLYQWIKRRSLFKVDFDILILGVYYMIVIIGYLFFEMIPINYRPILINGSMEASYPSSTTLLILSVMPTFTFQTKNRINNRLIRNIIQISTILFSGYMVIVRLISGVHWLSDIIGSIMLSFGVFYMYKGIVLLLKEITNR